MTSIAAHSHSKTAMNSLVGELRAQGSAPKPAASALTYQPARFSAEKVAPDQAQVEKQVRNWVGESFYGTLLKQMRDDPFKTEMFDGGKGGEAYNQLFDQRLAQHMAGGVGSKIVRPIVKKLISDKQGAALKYQRQSKATSSQEAAHVSTDRRA